MGNPTPVDYESRRPTEVAPPTAARDACARCGYELLGVADDAPCPECGLLAERSRQPADAHLSDATPGWLAGISVGVSLVLLAHLLAPAWAILLVVAGSSPAGRPLFVGNSVAPAHLTKVGFDLAALTLIVGVWLLTRPQRPDTRDGLLRGSLRVASLVPMLLLTLLHASYSTKPPTFGRQPVELAFLLLLTVGLAPIPALMFTLLRRLAKRVLNPGLAEHAAIVGVGLSLTFVAIPVMVWVMLEREDLPLSRATKYALQVWVPLLTIVAFLLFAGWSALNCVRFAAAFARARAGARRKWRLADRALAA